MIRVTSKLVLLACVIGCALTSRAQDQSNVFPKQTAPGISTAFNTVPEYTRSGRQMNAPSLHIVSATVTGSPTACSFQVYGSLKTTLQHPVYPADYFQLTAPQDCSTPGLAAVGSSDRPALTILINLVTLSGGTTPSVTFTYLGKVR